MATTLRKLALCGLFILLTLRTASTETATWYVSAGSWNLPWCGSTGTPCGTVTAALKRVNPGDTIIVMPGTYTEPLVALTSPSHQRVTITTTAAAIAALGTFTRGIPSGTESRPYFSNAHFTLAASGVSLSYLRVRNGPSPHDGAYDGVIGVDGENVTVDHNEVWNGNQGIAIVSRRLVAIRNNHIHTLGSMTSSEDTHGVSVCATSGTIASGWSEAITIDSNTIHDVGGDGVQEMTNAYCSGTFRYLVVSNNDIYNNQEQGFDSKGTSDVHIFGNNIYGNGEGGIVATNDPKVVAKSRWQIYGNRIHDHNNYAITWAQAANCDTWLIYDNLIYNNVKMPDYNYAAVGLCGDAESKVYNNVFYNNTDTSGGNKTSAIKDSGSGAGIVNNIFYNNGIGANDHGAIADLAHEDGGLPSNNYIYPATCASGSCKTGTNVVTACMEPGNCPGFVDVAAYDFHLKAGSPAIHRGIVLAAPFSTDFEGKRRAAGPWDLGALEFVAVAR